MYIIKNSKGQYLNGFSFNPRTMSTVIEWSSERIWLIKSENLEEVKKDIYKIYTDELTIILFEG